jgi:anti-sigma factor RsiW
MNYTVNCDRISSAMIPYLDGRASAAEQSAVEAHAAVCPLCRERIEEFRKLFGVLNEMPMIEPSGAFDPRVRQRIAAEPRRSAFEWLLPAPRLAFALAMLLVVSVWIGKFQPADNSVATSQSEQDFHVIKDLGVLENYDVLKSFDALSELPVAAQEPAQTQQEQPQKDGQI